MTQVQTVRSLEHAARESARSAVVEVAQTNPALVAGRLVESPELANGLKDFDFIVEALIKGGQRDAMTRLADSRVLNTRERTILVEKLLVIM